jgi:hypothetical protein
LPLCLQRPTTRGLLLEVEFRLVRMNS